MAATEYRLFGDGVLAEYRDKADEPEFWSGLWNRTDFRTFFARYTDGQLGEFAEVFPKYLPKNRPVLEAGCGRGQYVCALRALGYEAIGVDFAADLVDGIRAAIPDLDVRVGDVRRLDFPDHSLGAYISLGVVEHFWEGMEPILAEAHRVLDEDGVLLLSVPHYSPTFRRRTEGRLEKATTPQSESGHHFYQFYFSAAEIEARLQHSGFRPVDRFYYAAKYGAKRAYPLFDAVYDSSYFARVALDRLFRLPVPQIVQRSFAHMIMIVAVKESGGEATVAGAEPQAPLSEAL